MAQAKQAHDDLIAAAYRAQADALEIEAQAKRKLADEYDAAQERGDVESPGGDRTSNIPERNNAVTLADVGISAKEIHDARIIRDAEVATPGIVRRTLDDALAAGEEPTKAKVNRAARKAAKRPTRKPATTDLESQHDRDLRMLMGVWEAACAATGLANAWSAAEVLEARDVPLSSNGQPIMAAIDPKEHVSNFVDVEAELSRYGIVEHHLHPLTRCLNLGIDVRFKRRGQPVKFVDPPLGRGAAAPRSLAGNVDWIRHHRGAFRLSNLRWDRSIAYPPPWGTACLGIANQKRWRLGLNTRTEDTARSPWRDCGPMAR